MEEVKKKVLQFLATSRRNPENKSSTLCLTGPPGVGKTSIAESLSRALRRPYVQLALGGVHDEADIRGHRRTYIGALPGLIMQLINQSGAMDCIFVLDEIDKLGENGAHGNPAAALLELLDPKQNDRFVDRYVNGSVDLSRVFFVCTGNKITDINPTLRDRLNIVELEGYDVYERFKIAKDYLVPRQIKNSGVEGLVSFSDEAIWAIINEYTAEAGVRDAEHHIQDICGEFARRFETTGEFTVNVNEADVREIFGEPKIQLEKSRPTDVGCSTGLAVLGDYIGHIIFAETQLVPKVLGKLYTGVGENLIESAEKAMSAIVRIGPNFREQIEKVFRKNSLRFNMGEMKGGVEGPSAGIASLCALYSLITDALVREKLAMTGAINMTMGDVCRVGGIKAKVLGASKAGITELILPEKNRADYEKVNEKIRDSFEKVHFVKTTDEVLKIVFGEDFANKKFE